MSIADTVDLFVDLRAVVIASLTGTSDLVANSSRVPRADTSNLAETSVGLSWETSHTPTTDYTLKAFAFGDTYDVNHIVLGEYSLDGHFSLEEALGPINLGGNITSVHLNLHQMGLLLAEANLADLSVSQDTDNLAVLGHACQLRLDILAILRTDALGITGVCLLLGAIPILVESTFYFIAEVSSPDSGKRAETTRSLNIANNTHNLQRRSFDDSDSLNSFFLVELGAWFVNLTKDMGHSSLVTQESSEVGRLGLIIFRKCSNSATEMGGPLARQKAQTPATRMLKFTV